MKRLSDKARMYARTYTESPLGREIMGTAELLLQMADELDKYKDLEEQGKLLKLTSRITDLQCFVPEKNNPYPLCTSRELPECKECQLRADWEPDHVYGM